MKRTRTGMVMTAGALAAAIVALVVSQSGADSIPNAGGMSDTAVAEHQAKIDAHYRELQQAGLVNPRPTPESAGLKDEPPADAWEGGLVSDPEYPGSGWSFTTAWISSTDATNLAVYAGAPLSDPKSPALVVVQQDRATYEVSKILTTPDTTGPLRIVDGPDGRNRLTIANGNGDLMTFDLTDMAFD